MASKGKSMDDELAGTCVDVLTMSRRGCPLQRHHADASLSHLVVRLLFHSLCVCAVSPGVELMMTVEYEVTVRILGARIPDVVDSFCVITLTHPCTHPRVWMFVSASVPCG